jgi:hypothetical protein
MIEASHAIGTQRNEQLATLAHLLLRDDGDEQQRNNTG